MLLRVIILFILGATSANAQLPAKLTGQVRDVKKNLPLSSVTITLHGITKHQVISDEKGNFSFEKTDTTYTLHAKLLGYKPFSSKITGSQMLILLEPEQRLLSTVEVTSQKPLIRQYIDRIVYDVQQDDEKKTSNLLDILPKVPFLSMGPEDNLLLKGSANFLILINGKPSPMANTNPRQFLRSLQAANIKEIEVITIPPSKYDGEGVGGIINIIPQRKLVDGYNGNINVNYGNLYYGNNGNINLKSRKLGITAAVSQLRNIAQRTSVELIRNSADKSNLMQSGYRKGYSNTIFGSVLLSYEIDSLNLFTMAGSISGGIDRGEDEQQVLFAEKQAYKIHNMDKSDPRGYDLSLDYQFGFPQKKEQLLTFSYQRSGNKVTSFATNQFSEQLNSNFNNYDQHNNTNTLENIAQVDFITNAHKIEIEVGAKYIGRDNKSNFHNLFYTPGDTIYTANSYDHQQRIISAYNTWSLKWKQWALKAGVRLERTIISAGDGSSVKKTEQHYSNLLPTLIIQKKLDNYSNVRIGYSNRIQRPGISQLNPFVTITDPRFITTGNPSLMPVKNHKIELNYSNFKKMNIIVSTAYIFSNNAIQYVTKLGADSISRTGYENIGRRNVLNINADITHRFNKKLRMKISGNLAYIKLQGAMGDSHYENNGMEGLTYGYLYYKFTSGYQVSLNAGFSGQTVRLQGVSKGYFYHSIGLSKSFFKDRFYTRLTLANPFSNSIRLETSLNGNNFQQRLYNERVIRNLNISVALDFGKLKENVKRNKRSVSNDDKVTE